MKAFVTILIGVFVFFNSFSQVKTIYIKTPGITCEDCEAFVENRMMNLTGILEIDVNPWGKTTKVAFLPTRTDANTVRLIIASLGFVADTTLPTDLRFVSMPQCCRETAKKSYELTLADNIKQRAAAAAKIVPKKDTPIVKPVAKPTLPVKPTSTKPTIVKPAATKPATLPKKG